MNSDVSLHFRLRVMPNGLQNANELSGKCCMPKELSASSWRLEVDAEDGVCVNALKPENLQVEGASPMTLSLVFGQGDELDSECGETSGHSSQTLLLLGQPTAHGRRIVIPAANVAISRIAFSM